MGAQTTVALTAALSVGLLILPGCGRAPDPHQEGATRLAQQLEEIVQAHGKLAAVRAELAGLTAELAGVEATDERERTAVQKARAEELKRRIGQSAATATSLYGDVQRRLADYLNVALNDFPEAPGTATALRLYADEAILDAQDMVRKAGDYRQAIELLQGVAAYYQAAGLQPYPAVVAALEELERRRASQPNASTPSTVR